MFGTVLRMLEVIYINDSLDIPSGGSSSLEKRSQTPPTRVLVPPHGVP